MNQLYSSTIEFLRSLPYTQKLSDKQLRVRCPFCGGSKSDRTAAECAISFFDDDVPLYHCFRASCMKSGVLTPDVLREFGCSDMDILLDLAKALKNSNHKFDKHYAVRRKKDLNVVNVKSDLSAKKLQYINHRMGTDFSYKDLADLRIQLNLYEFLRGNWIKKLRYKENFCDALDKYCVGFVSMYQDFIILRDCTKNLVTGRRYFNYRLGYKTDGTETKVYAIPGEIDLLDPSAANINVAEGAFSILGAYLHTDYGRDKKNSIFMANCGSAYRNTILGCCAQFGLVKVNLHIWSDSEVPVAQYKKLYKDLKDNLIINHFTVYYNDLAEDFGQPPHKIKVRVVSIK